MLFADFSSSYNSYEKKEDKESFKREYATNLVNQVSDLNKEMESYRPYLDLNELYESKLNQVTKFIDNFDTIVSERINPFERTDLYYEIVD